MPGVPRGVAARRLRPAGGHSPQLARVLKSGEGTVNAFPDVLALPSGFRSYSR